MRSLRATTDLVTAIETGQLVLEYQPEVDVGSGTTKVFEALVRWDHPELGRLGPDSFLTLADNAGLAGLLTHWVLVQAISDATRWRRHGMQARLAVNVSPQALADPALPEHTAALLEDSVLDPADLVVEVTERHCTMDLDAVARAMKLLGSLGVSFSLDDFGTGDSSLARIQQLQFDEIKIDRSFVTHLATAEADRHIVRFATQLAHALGMRVVAEGVESAAAMTALDRLEVDLAQGYHLSRPGPLEGFLAPSAPRA